MINPRFDRLRLIKLNGFNLIKLLEISPYKTVWFRLTAENLTKLNLEGSKKAI